jgi:hypothetical protein
MPAMSHVERNFLLKHEVDFAVDNIAANADVVALIAVPAETLVKVTTLDVVTAEGATLVAALGAYADADDSVLDADAFGGAVDLNATGKTASLSSYYFEVDGYIGLTRVSGKEAPINTGKVRVQASCEVLTWPE